MTTEALEATLQRIEDKLDRLSEDVNAPPRHGEPGGLLVRQEKTDTTLDRILSTLEELRRRIEALEATPGKTAITWWDRVGLGILGLVLTAIGGVIGAQYAGHVR